MKKILPIIAGVLIGIIVSVSFIRGDNNNKTAYGAINFWDDVVVGLDSLGWKDIFSAAGKGRNLYSLVHDKLMNAPGRDALKEVSQKYGLTKEEAQAVLDGSVTPIFNNQNRRSAKFTLEDAYRTAQKLQEDFALLNEVFALQQEIDVAIAPSEMFANGELLDSGFDLVYDLTVIEEILFLEKSETTVGKPFDKALDSPYLPTEEDQTLTDYIAPEGPGAVGKVDFKKSALTGPEAVLTVGDTEIDVEVLDEDICPSDTSLADALNSFEEENAPEGEDGAGEAPAGEGGEGDGGGGDDEEPPEEEAGEQKKLEPAPADEWREAWCPAMGGEDGAEAWNTFGQAGFTSLGGVANSLINQTTGAAAGVQASGISLQVGICLDTKLIWKTYVSYQPGESCILCEVEQINELMDKTLNHSLMHNKATGNLMESAKCKDTFASVPYVDMQFISIAAPVPTPPGDDIIFGKNIFEEWKKFVDRYQPFMGLGSGKDEDESIEQFELQTVPEDTTQAELLNSINALMAKKKTEAKKEIEDTKRANEGSNVTGYAQIILLEIRQMKSFFEGYLGQYNKIGEETCPDILNKKDTD